MVEKIISLENVSLINFLGTNDQNIKEIAAAFPECRIISRGDEIRIVGSTTDILQLNEIFNLLLEHYHRFGKITSDDVRAYIERDVDSIQNKRSDDTLVHGSKGNPIKPRTANQHKLVKSAQENDIVFALGPAGTGKTYVAVALAVKALKNKQVKKIIITRPAVEAGESLGFLPGDMREKIDPYLRPIFDALEDMIPPEKLKYYQEKNVIEIAPIAFMRGRTLHEAFVLLDEAQNTTTMQMKMFLTRLGASSKMIITGDMSQIDLPKKVKSGLVEASHILKNVNGIGFVEFDEKDVVRHKLVKSIINAYQKYEDNLPKDKE